MSSRAARVILGLVALLALPCAGLAQSPATPAAEVPDLDRQPTLYVVPYAHLDTQWRWDCRTTIAEYLPSTMRDNFALIERYPHYVFNFSGANRYRMMKEYFPADFARLARYVAAGRWFPSGSSMEENDVNVPSAESILRQVLYGKEFFRRELGRTSAEYMLPDCFGFPASLPSLLAHAGLRGFSTQKLSWKSARGIPFNVGVWEGLDGHGIVAALNAMDYTGEVEQDLTVSPPPGAAGARGPLVDWPARIRENGAKSGVPVDFSYYGTGDIGGAPKEPSVALTEAVLTKGVVAPGVPLAASPDATAPVLPAPGPDGTVALGRGPLRVVQGPAERMFLDITKEQAARLPRYKGDLLLIEHSAGSLTSQAYMKRWNRRNELLADAAERASVAADWLGARPYPRERLDGAWTLVMGGQFHDILPGTSVPKAYEFSWNDELLALNQFGGVLSSATEGIASGLDTTARGAAVIVYNPLNVAREDVVEVSVPFTDGAPRTVRVVGPDGHEVASQIVGGGAGTVRVLFLAPVPAVGFAVFDVQPAQTPTVQTEVRVTDQSIENARYRVRIDADGDVASLFDKRLGRELLRAPIRLALQTERPVDWPAWNMDWADQQKPPRAFVAGPATIRVVERGPVRAAIEVTRVAEGSRFVQTLRLAAGDAGHRVEFANAIDWKVEAAALKATFPLTAANPDATYNWDVGTIQRGSNEPTKFEVPSHQWFDLTDRGGDFGVTILSDCKYGSDKPDDSTLRLTLIYTPGIGTGNGRDYADQSTQDWGHHEFVYGLAGHAGDWRREQTDWQAQRLNQPLVAYLAPAHDGPLGRTFSVMSVSSTRLRVLALKKAQDSDEVVVRLVELDGRPARGVRVRFASPVVAAREINGAEEPVGPATLSDGALVADLGGYEPRTYAVKLAPPAHALAGPRSQAVPLPFDTSVSRRDGAAGSAAAFDTAGRSLAAEMLPADLQYAGARFALAPAGAGSDALTARGQSIALPAGPFTRVYVLAASAEEDRRASFRVGQQSFEATVHHWGGYIGQWDNRTWNVREEVVPPAPGEVPPTPGTPPRTRTVMEYTGLVPGYLKPSPVAWFASHRHAPDGTNEPYAYSYLFAYAFDVTPGASTLTLPNDDQLRVLAVTVTDEGQALSPADPEGATRLP